jgi:hypothetical protein
MTAHKDTLGWHARPHGGRTPDPTVEDAVLESNESSAWRPYDLSLGDLAIRACCHGMIRATPGHESDGQSFENACLETLAVELKALAAAMASDGTDNDEPDPITLSEVEVVRMVNGLARRAAAAAEFGRRLQSARWEPTTSEGTGETEK